MITLDFNERLIAFLDGPVDSQPSFSTVYGEISFITKTFIGAKSSEGYLNNLNPVVIVEEPDDVQITRRDIRSLSFYFSGTPPRKLTIQKLKTDTLETFTLFSAIINTGFSVNYDGSFKVLSETGALITASSVIENTVISGSATDIVYNNLSSKLQEATVQGAIDELAISFESFVLNLRGFNVIDTTFNPGVNLSKTYSAPGGNIVVTTNFIDGKPSTKVLSGPGLPVGIPTTKTYDFAGRTIPLVTYS